MDQLLGDANLALYNAAPTIPCNELASSLPSSPTLKDVRRVALAALHSTLPDDTDALQDALVSPVLHSIASSSEDETLSLTAEAVIALLTKLPHASSPSLILALLISSTPSLATPTASTAASTLISETTTVDLLKDYFRPLFKDAAKTATGHSLNATSIKTTPTINTSLSAPAWRTKGSPVPVQFQCTVIASSADTVAQNWPLYVPVLVTLCEEADLSIRAAGLRSLSAFLQNCPARILKNTGIDAVFEKTVLPSLSFLPSLTPEDDSLTILRPAYDALIQLGKMDDKGKLLDRVLREGILAGYAHAEEYVRIVEELLRISREIVQALGINTVKHLSNLLEMYSKVLTSPFALIHAADALEAILSLQVTIQNCWPRLQLSDDTCEQIYSMLCISWVNLDDEKTTNATPPALWTQVGDELVKTGCLVRAAGNDAAWTKLKSTKAKEIQDYVAQVEAQMKQLQASS